MNFKQKTEARKEAYSGDSFKEALAKAYQLGVDDTLKSVRENLEDRAGQIADNSLELGLRGGIFTAIGIVSKMETGEL